MCRALKISESRYYRWLKNRNKPTARELLSVEIKAILDEHPDNDNYGVKRMTAALEQKGIQPGPVAAVHRVSGHRLAAGGQFIQNGDCHIPIEEQRQCAGNGGG